MSIYFRIARLLKSDETHRVVLNAAAFNYLPVATVTKINLHFQRRA